jgi:hypothetical protein
VGDVDLENRAAAAASWVLNAKARRCDLGGSSIRDFDLLFDDGHVEPLEVTAHVAASVRQTWARIEDADQVAPTLTRVWTVNHPSGVPDPRGDRSQPYDVRRCLTEAEPALAVLEAAGYEQFDAGLVWRVEDSTGADAMHALARLAIDFALSRPPEPGEQPRIQLGAAVGGVVTADLVAHGVEQEAADPGNQAKLATPSEARRRHLFVVFDGSSGPTFSAAAHGMIGRLPNLPAPITTAWAAGSSQVLVATPPGPWETHAIPSEVFEQPERWLVP